MIVVFDLGKVLLDFDYSMAARRIAVRARRPIDVTTFFAEKATLLLRYELGLVTTTDFCEELCRACDFDGTVMEFEGYFSDIFTPIVPMMELHAAVRRAAFPTFIFSNTNELAITHIRKNFAFYSDFNGYILSYEHGAMKPDAKLFEVVERQTGGMGREIVYIDDRPENAAAGRARGWTVVLHESPTATREAVSAVLKLP
jgi:FMN phosphatase YigB (HAD superfamily)